MTTARVLDRVGVRVRRRRFAHGADPAASVAPGAAPIYAMTDAAAISTYLQGLASIGDSCAPSDGFNFDGGAGQFTVGAFLGAGSLSATYNAAAIATPHGFGIRQTHGVVGSPTYADAEAWQSDDDVLFAFDEEPWLILARLTVTAIATDGFERGLLGRGSAASPHYALMLLADGTLKARAKVGFGGPPTTTTLAGSVADGVPRWIAFWRSITSAQLGVARAGAAATTALGAGSSYQAGKFFAFGDTVGSSDPFVGGPDAVADHLLGFRTHAEPVIANIGAILTALEAAEV